MNSLRLDEIDIETLRKTGGMKWAAFPGAIGAFVAEMDFGVAPAIGEALHKAVDEALFGYLPEASAVAMSTACADWHHRSFGWNVPAERIYPVADVLKGLEIAIESFSAPGSAVILPTPAYMPFFRIPRSMGREIIEVPMILEGDRYVLDYEAVEEAFVAGGGLLVLCNPYNPLGRVFTREELESLAAIVDRHAGRVFADEIHSALVYVGHRHVPYASISEITGRHTITATSASKAWNLPGLKCAQLILSNDTDTALWEKIGLRAKHGASNLGVLANTAAYRSGEAWLQEVLAYIDGNRRELAGLLEQYLPAVRYTMPEGTYIAWLDCRQLDLGVSPADFFRELGGVALTDGLACGAPGKGFVRLVFATPRPILRQAVRQMAQALPRRREYLARVG